VVPGSLTISAGITVPAGQERVWDLAVDWAMQRKWIWATTTSGGHGLGATVTGRTGIGPIGFTDTMLITEWDPPSRCAVRHTGTIVRGDAAFEVRPRGSRCEFIWTERIFLPAPLLTLVPEAFRPAFTRLAYSVIAPAGKAGLRSCLIRFARLLPSARP
jgi:hypothetical protein